MSRRELPKILPPLKMQALQDMTFGPIRGSWGNGWVSQAGNAYNSHTIGWIVSVGWAEFDKTQTIASITRDGRTYLQQISNGWSHG